ncbi:MAG: transposase [Truepera sp.]|nr:transposase [Truepera sp.]
MASSQRGFLRGVVEADETYIGGRPRKRNRRIRAAKSVEAMRSALQRPGARRGRGTKKTAILGVVERGGQVRAQVADDLTGRGILRFIRDTVHPEDDTVLITDEYAAYEAVRPYMPHLAINHQEHYSDRSGGHTNTIDP